MFLADERVRTSDGRATGGTAGPVCGGRVMPFIAVGGHTSTTISMPFVEQLPGSVAAGHAVAKRRASWRVAAGRRRSGCGTRTRRLTSHAPDGAPTYRKRAAGDALTLGRNQSELNWSHLWSGIACHGAPRIGGIRRERSRAACGVYGSRPGPAGTATLHWMGIHEISRMIASRAVSPVTLTRHMLDRIRTVDANLQSTPR